MSRALGVSRSGYYVWRKNYKSKRKIENEQLLIEIKTAFKKSRRTYGSPRITAALSKPERRCNKKRVARLMRENGIRAKTKRKFKVTTHSSHSYLISPNMLSRENNVTITGVNQVWVSDITYLWTTEGWMYLAVIIDLYHRGVVGWTISDRLTRDIVIAAFNQAVERRRPTAGLIFHSDRGVQYANNEFRAVLTANKFVSSMSGKGNCYDNAYAETFFKTLKTEHTYWFRYETRVAAKSSVFEYIEVFYNRTRLHSSLGYMSPVEFENLSLQKVA
jgi:transposase InsO family protein